MLNIDATFLVVFVIIWILVFVLNKVFFNPMRRIRDVRRGELDRNQGTARRALEEYDRTLERLEQSLREARSQADRTRESLSAEALKEKAKLLGDVGAEYRRNVEKAKEDLRTELQGLKRDMDSRVESLARKIEERLVS
jgi:F-type H+-transporting ATPase subunit b